MRQIVGVEEDDQFAVHLVERVGQRRGLARSCAVRAVDRDDPSTRHRREAVENGRGAVLRAIVDDDDLELVRRIMELEQMLEASGQHASSLCAATSTVTEGHVASWTWLNRLLGGRLTAAIEKLIWRARKTNVISALSAKMHRKPICRAPPPIVQARSAITGGGT